MKNHFYYLMGLLLLNSCVKEDPIFNAAKFACTTALVNTHPEGARYQDFLDEKVAKGLPGISMLVETPEGIWSGGAGVADIPNNIAMQSCSLHKIGSITKLFTASLILKLYENGALGLDDPIANYLSPTIVKKIDNAETATIRHLLTHSSGIADYLSQLDYTLFDYYDNPTKVWTAEEELEYIFGESADFAAGEKVEYSNSNYLLLGMIAENVTKIKGEVLYKDLIYDPLGMDDTFFFQNGAQPERLVRGYFDEFGDGALVDITRLRRFSNSMVGGISSTVQDLHVFTKAAFTPNMLFTQETIDEMLTLSNIPFGEEDFDFGSENKTNRVNGIALGWFQLDTDYGIAYGHNGGFNGRRARLWHFPEAQSTIIFMYNASGESIESIEKELFRNEMIELLFE